jgi:hypothetical protein
VEEEQRLVTLREQRAEEYRKQQAALEQMKQENEVRLQALQAERNRLARDRAEMKNQASEVAVNPEVLKELPRNRSLSLGEVVYVENDGRCAPGKILKVTGGKKSEGIKRKYECVFASQSPASEAKIDDKVASVHPVQKVAGKTVVFAPRSEWLAGSNAHYGTQAFSSRDEYSMAIARSMSQKASSVLPGNFTSKVIVEGNNQDLHYDGSDHEVARQVCQEQDADLLVMPLLENVGNAYRTLTYSIAYFDCKSDDYQIREFSISEKQGEAFPFETVMNDSFRTIWRENISHKLR